MKILKHGSQYKRFICYRCKCKFEATINECEPYFSTARKTFYYCKCPECGAEVYMESVESGINKVRYIEACPYRDKNYKVKRNKGASGSGS